VSFFFHPELESLANVPATYAESLGKEHDIDGNKVDTGITPTVALGFNGSPFHRQLYLGGPRDKFTTFIYTEEHAEVPKFL